MYHVNPIEKGVTVMNPTFGMEEFLVKGMNPTFGMEEFLMIQPFEIPVFESKGYTVTAAVRTMIPNSTLIKLLPIK